MKWQLKHKIEKTVIFTNIEEFKPDDNFIKDNNIFLIYLGNPDIMYFKTKDIPYGYEMVATMKRQWKNYSSKIFELYKK